MKEDSMAKADYELVKELLKPPLRVMGITPGTDQPEKPQFEEHFGSLEEAYTFFRPNFVGSLTLIVRDNFLNFQPRRLILTGLWQLR
jgi:hypothetical protein